MRIIIFIFSVCYFITNSFTVFAKREFSIEGKLSTYQGYLVGSLVKLRSENETFTQTTQLGGTFKFEHLDSGKYTLIINKLGYEKVDTTFYVTDLSYQNLEIYLKQKKFEISGNIKVVSGIGKEIFDKIPIRLNNRYQTFFAQTDENGFFEVKYLTKGKYKVNIGRFGYSKTDTTIVIDGYDDKIENFNLTIFEKCQLNRESALQDIKTGKIKLLIQGGMVPKTNNKFDNEFEKEYNLNYYDFGCTYIGNECMEDYNKTIFEYLDDKYGNRWKKKIRKDVIGIESYLESK